MKRTLFLLFLLTSLFNLSAQIIPEGTYCIKYAHNPNFCMDLSENGKIANGQNILLWTYWGGNGQKWIVTHEKGGIVIRSYVNRNYVVDLLNGSAKDDNNIHLHQYNGSSSQIWYPEYVEGYYTIHNGVNQNFCIDLYCGNAVDGTNIQIYSDNRAYYPDKRAWPQRWIFERIEENHGGYSTPQSYPQTPQSQIEKCTHCYGTGKCSTCHGRGLSPNTSRPQACGACGGNGRCTLCHGTGYF